MKLNRGIVFALSVIAVLGFGVISNGALYPKDKRQWSSTGRMMVARQGACAVGFEDGRVLITGGSNATGVTATAEFLGVNGGAAPAASMSFPRTGHMCVPLNDGTVLVAGGRTTGDAVTASAELFDPIANTWRSIDWMASARVGATASVLDDGRVLIAGGESGSVPLASLEIFDPATASFSTLSTTLSSPRTQHAATLLKDGRVVIAGGYDGSAPSDAIEIFDPSTGAVALLARMSSPRAGLSATTLLDGRVYLAGGNDGRADLASTEILDPATGALAASATMDTPRRDHIAFRVPHNNAVIIIGGTYDAQSLSSAGLYIPWRNTYEPTGQAVSGLAGAAASLVGESGMIRVAGGSLRSMSESSTSALTLPTIMTDKLDYAPGESVTISGANWTPGNTVDLIVKILPEGTVTRWEGTAVVNADGTILLENAFQMTRDDAYQSFSLTATEQGTGLTAQEWLFTDAPKVGSVSVSAQSQNPVTAGNSATYTVTVDRGSGSDGSGNFTADLSVTTALPAGASASFSPNPVTLAPAINSASATLTITTTGATPAGTTPFTVRAARNAADFAEGSGNLVVQSGLNQSITVTTPAPASAAYNSSFTVAATASSGLAVAITTSGSCSGSGSGSANITMTSSTGTCTVHYNQAGNATYNPASELTSNTSALKADQAPLSVTGPSNVTYGTTGTATTTGGSGTGLVTFSTGASTGCSVSGTTVSVTNASGTCSLTATKAADANYNEATSAAFPVTLHKANQAALTVTGPSDITYGNTGTAAATGGSGTGALTFSSGASTGCSVGGTTVSVSDASGTCALTATKAVDDNYNEATSVAFTVNLHKAAQAALNVTGPTEVTYGTTGTATAAGGTGAGALTFSAGASTGCAVVGTTVSVTNASGTCALTATKAADNNYLEITSPSFGVTLHKANQSAVTVTGPSEATYGIPGTATATGGDGTGAYVFSAGASAGCSVVGTTVTVINASSTCTLTATRNGDNNYNPSAQSAAFPVTLHKANQAALTVTGPSDITYGNTGTATASGGSGTGTLSFSSGASTGCSVGGTTVSVSDASGTCALTATKAADDNYNEATSVAFTVNLHKAAQAALNVTGPTEVTYGTTGTATAAGGTGTGALTFSAGASTGCAVVGTTVSVTNASGICALTATKAADNNYLEITSPSFGVTLHKANQSAVTVTGPSDATFGIPGTATATGGDGTGSYVFSAGASTGCTVVGTTVTVVNASSTCTLTATRDGDNNYNPSAQSAAFPVTLHKATQAINVTTAAPPSAVYNTSFGVAATGGASGNPVLIATSGVCSGSGSGSASITMTSGTGTCTVHYNQAGSDNYEAAPEVTSNTAAQKADPVITWSNPADIVYNAALSGTQLNATADVPGAFVYNPPAGTILDASPNQPLQANFTPTETQNYNTATKTVHINVLKSDTATTLISSPNPSVYGQSVSFTATVTAVAPGGGTPTGTVEFKEGSTVLGSAALSGGSATLNLSSLNATTHTITAHYQESTNYKPSTSNSVSQVVNKASTTTTVLSNLNPSIFGTLVTFTATVTPIAPGGGIPDGTVTFTDTSTLTVLCSNVPLNGSGAGACQTAALAFGSHTISAAYTPGASNNYLGSSGSVVQLVDKATVSATVTVNPATQQYSDKVTFSVVVPGTSINGQTAVNAGATAYFAVGTLGLANCTLAYDGTNFTCTTDATALLETLGANQVSPGAKTVSVTFSAVNPNFIINNTTTTLTITQEHATAEYTGPDFAFTSSSGTTANVTLSVTLKDPVSPDTDTGDIRNAKVRFLVDGAVACTATVGLVNPADPTVGVASCNTTLNIGSADSDDFDIDIVEASGSYYTFTEKSILTVSKPSGTSFITGGGYLLLASPSGTLNPRIGSKNNFGFNVKYNKKGTNLQGNINTIVRTSDGKVIQIKGNALLSLAVKPTVTGGTAIFTGKANATDVTNPLAPIALGGNLTLQVAMTDNGEPGNSDTIAITVFDKDGGIWYVSNWSGTKSIEQLLKGGNLVVH